MFGIPERRLVLASLEGLSVDPRMSCTSLSIGALISHISWEIGHQRWLYLNIVAAVSHFKLLYSKDYV
jgi:hypothetical protein